MSNIEERLRRLREFVTDCADTHEEAADTLLLFEEYDKLIRRLKATETALDTCKIVDLDQVQAQAQRPELLRQLAEMRDELSQARVRAERAEAGNAITAALATAANHAYGWIEHMGANGIDFAGMSKLLEELRTALAADAAAAWLRDVRELAAAMDVAATEMRRLCAMTGYNTGSCDRCRRAGLCRRLDDARAIAEKRGWIEKREE